MRKGEIHNHNSLLQLQLGIKAESTGTDKHQGEEKEDKRGAENLLWLAEGRSHSLQCLPAILKAFYILRPSNRTDGECCLPCQRGYTQMQDHQHTPAQRTFPTHQSVFTKTSPLETIIRGEEIIFFPLIIM